MSTHNICFCWEIRKISAFLGWKKCLICCYGIVKDQKRPVGQRKLIKSTTTTTTSTTTSTTTTTYTTTTTKSKTFTLLETLGNEMMRKEKEEDGELTKHTNRWTRRSWVEIRLKTHRQTHKQTEPRNIQPNNTYELVFKCLKIQHKLATHQECV